ncbi:hypothetical protein BJY04DRAFT_220330 [Aspergillus karnatakaensis]|uniref:CVNH domain-containing protein n=1 Tax=Aspergillus karnatakaensis TaxID=1810916 RepID=UPI003CCE2A93
MFLPTTVLAILSLTLLSLASGFTRSYRDVVIDSTDCHFIIAKCTAYNGAVKTSKLDLNFCMGNDRGRLVASSGIRVYANDIPCKCTGNAFGNCKQTGAKCEACTFSAPGIISCMCPDNVGFVRQANGDLDAIVSNLDGVLHCHGRRGVVL